VRGKATQPLPLAYFTAKAAYDQGNYQGAMQLASEGIELIDRGVLDASDEAKAQLLWVGFSSAYRLGEMNTAGTWAAQLAPLPQPWEQHIQFLFMAAEVHLRLGDSQQASHDILTLVGQGPRPEYYRDSDVIEQSYRIYGNLYRAGFEGQAMEFLRQYAHSIPATVTELKEAYEDSITVFSTRAKLASGFEAWRNTSYGQVVSFYESILTQGGLTPEEEVISRQLLAAAYFAFGRRAEAEDTFREIFNLRPDFVLAREIPRIRTLYALTIYNPETERFFGDLRPNS
jgi:tetratricopeptide (TPR) repeat protein